MIDILIAYTSAIADRMHGIISLPLAGNGDILLLCVLINSFVSLKWCILTHGSISFLN
jgi:hypothetical protein